ncbi:PREDICTED: uncharacterized protein LOC107881417 [Prunus mume]|uniref:Uncharacterized protein LOC107881417 n=1 Tax=Prunus mume TaxID=102107 RepID=A0ABM1LTC9_PRUMU|nr:PREDICTED: uncharacterized protein LOC107881417 [Prunus mume]
MPSLQGISKQHCKNSRKFSSVPCWLTSKMETIVILVCYNEKWVTSKKMCKYEGGDSKGLIVPRTITFAELLDRVHQIDCSYELSPTILKDIERTPSKRPCQLPGRPAMACAVPISTSNSKSLSYFIWKWRLRAMIRLTKSLP